MTVRIPPPLDDYARGRTTECPNLIIRWWLMASYVYYHADGMIITDGFFDELSRTMVARWDTLSDPNKHLIDVDALRAGTGFHLRESDYPARLVAAAGLLLEHGACESYDGTPHAPASQPSAVAPPPMPKSTKSGQLEMF